MGNPQNHGFPYQKWSNLDDLGVPSFLDLPRLAWFSSTAREASTSSPILSSATSSPRAPTVRLPGRAWLFHQAPSGWVLRAQEELAICTDEP